jgi:DNA-cytosine methyltransferase
MNKIIKLIKSFLQSNKKQDKGITVVSLFDGGSCALVALKEMGIKVDKYIASEVDVHAIKVSSQNHPEIIQVGDVTKLNHEEILEMCGGHVDLLIGGSPCQDLSIAKSNRKGLSGARSGLFWNFVEAKEKLNPKYFLLENVASMSADNRQIISDNMGVDAININSNKLSAQMRSRLYWTNIPTQQPKDSKLKLKDILESGYTDKEKAYCLDANYFKGSNYEMYVKKSKRQIVFENKKIPVSAVKEGQETFLNDFVNGKVKMESANGKKHTPENDRSMKFNDRGFRKLTVTECERLQGLPDGYTDVEGVSKTERYRIIGNGFTVPVIKHILSGAFNN